MPNLITINFTVNTNQRPYEYRYQYYPSEIFVVKVGVLPHQPQPCHATVTPPTYYSTVSLHRLLSIYCRFWDSPSVRWTHGHHRRVSGLIHKLKQGPDYIR